MSKAFDITPTVTQYSALPRERVCIVNRFEDLPLAQVRRGIVYLLAAWSGPSVMHFRAITQALSRIASPGLEFYAVDIDCVPEDFMLATFQRRAPAGAGETIWVRDGAIVASVLTYSRAGAEAEFMRHTRELLDYGALSEAAAIEIARKFLRTNRLELSYPVSDTPSGKSSPRTLNKGKFAGRQAWLFAFDYSPPSHVLVDPTCVRILVDDASGEAAFFTPW